MIKQLGSTLITNDHGVGSVVQVPRPTPLTASVIARRQAVGERIRRVREHHNLSQRELCERTGIDIASYSRIEQGHSSPLLDTLIRISDAIGVELADLVQR
ncbi:helix-turn-helix transcriptional regulator [Streptomyces sp. SCSIO 30461]|uniref:helix-turn-helix domain-containing protein n=1 Tax=Streptomyces sp. SCSIO 30461 TaxID=3118085 RepID=UPI0030CBE739